MFSRAPLGSLRQAFGVQDLLTLLWREVFGEPPPLADDRQLLGQILVESLPPAPPYEFGRKVSAAPPSTSDASPAAAPDRREDQAA